MTKYNLSLDNPSPLLSYSPQTQWISIASKNDSSLYENTASATSQVGAEVSFTFRGTGVWIYGTKGEAHGYYNVTLDNTTQSFDGYSDTEEYQQVLFGANNLGLASHTVRIVNAGPLRGGDSNRVWLNIDWLTWETVFVGPGGPYGAEVFNATFNETHRRFFYIPPDAWSQRAYIDNVSINGTASYTTSSDASMQFVFDGDAVGLYGSLDGSFSANVDKGDFKSLTSTYNGSAYQQLLFYAENLGGGTHTLSIENSPQSTSTAKSTLAVDFARTWTARGGSSSNEPANNNTHRSLAGPIVGGVAGGFVIMVALISAVFFLRRRKGSILMLSRGHSQMGIIGALSFKGRTSSSRLPNSQSRSNSLSRYRSAPESTMSHTSGASDNPLLVRSHSPRSIEETRTDVIPMAQIRTDTSSNGASAAL